MTCYSVHLIQASQLVYQAHPEGGGGNISNYQQPREICLARKTIIQSSSEDYYSV